ncbi:hypothetical protein ACEZCY_17370 [Streptacidiphilus sp. N1-12]|uniref:Uncharacterized protein n=2 Tax=Streptacidiphilus alkalitolerans TaxID=3342712 RepID=A0ABV6WG35_9ACTN
MPAVRAARNLAAALALSAVLVGGAAIRANSPHSSAPTGGTAVADAGPAPAGSPAPSDSPTPGDVTWGG